MALERSELTYKERLCFTETETYMYISYFHIDTRLWCRLGQNGAIPTTLFSTFG
jgi:hypothetical protein